MRTQILTRYKVNLGTSVIQSELEVNAEVKMFLIDELAQFYKLYNLYL